MGGAARHEMPSGERPANPLSDSGGYEHRVARPRRQGVRGTTHPNAGKLAQGLGQTAAGGRLPLRVLGSRPWLFIQKKPTSQTTTEANNPGYWGPCSWLFVISEVFGSSPLAVALVWQEGEGKTCTGPKPGKGMRHTWRDTRQGTHETRSQPATLAYTPSQW